MSWSVNWTKATHPDPEKPNDTAADYQDCRTVREAFRWPYRYVRLGVPPTWGCENSVPIQALAALCIKTIAGIEAATAAKAVTDGFGDHGLDAIYFDQNSDALLIVQSKWSADGSTHWMRRVP